MKKIILFLAILGILTSCNKAGEGLQNFGAKDFYEAIQTNESKQILDVRTIDEYSQGHINGAIHADVNGVEFGNIIQKLDKVMPVYVYCLSGGRSSAAAQHLKEQGFKQIINLEGGILAWNASQLPLTQSTSTPQSKGMTLADYQALVKSKKSIIVDFNAVWCGPCKQLAPILDEFVKQQNGKVELIKIDVDQNQELAEALKIEAIPYVERYENGNLTWKKLGLFPASELK
jgi:thioredoxin